MLGISTKTYQVIVAVGDKMLFENTNSKKSVDEWLDSFNENGQATSIKIYKHIGHGGYELVHSQTRETERKIGFCRG